VLVESARAPVFGKDSREVYHFETAGKPPKSEERYCKQRCFMIKRIHERAT